MRTKKVNRYYCDYCKKSGCQARWIKKHEERCTLNPNRYCGYCHLLEQEQTDLNELLNLLPNPKDFLCYDEFGGEGYSATLSTAVEEALPKLREITGGCPACIMAALRQKGIPVPMASGFDFSEECRKIWNEFNAEQQEKESYGHYGVY